MDLRRVAAVRSLPVLLLTWLSGCVGLVGNDAATDGNDPPRNERETEDPNIQDAEMKRENPDLFAVAQRYFPGETAVPPKARLSRLTRLELDVTTRTLLPEHAKTAVVATMPPDQLQTNYEYASVLGFNAANFTPYAAWTEQIGASVKAAPSTVIDCTGSNNSATCLAAEAKKFVARAFRGVTSAEQLDKFAAFFTESAASVGVPAATADLVDLTLTSPSYVFRDEVLTGADGFLLPAQQFQNLTYTLAGAPAEAVGLTSTTPETYVLTDDDFAASVETLLSTPEARDKLMRFFVAWLEIKDTDKFTIGAEYPEFTPEVAAAVVDETRRFLELQLGKATPVLKDITESSSVFVSDKTSFLYGLDSPGEGSPMEVDPAERSGIFTQPAFLASHSPTSRSLVKRGVFFTRKVMCLPLGAPPSDAPTTLPTGEGSTEREIVTDITSPAKCAGCHAYINPFGFMLENFDAIGRFRTTHNGLPIDSSVDVDFLSEGPIQADTGIEALKKFTQSHQFQQCFVRQLFRFYTGRNEEAGDDPVLRQMFFQFANGDSQDIVEMLRIVANSSNFSMRSEAP